jgi:hypothetical protein
LEYEREYARRAGGVVGLRRSSPVEENVCFLPSGVVIVATLPSAS